MKHKLPVVLVILCGLAGLCADPPSERLGGAASRNCILVPNPTNTLLLRLYTNASPDSSHPFNTFDIEVNGRAWLSSPGEIEWKRASAGAVSNVLIWFHNLLLDHEGPVMGATNHMKVIESASGADWHYVSVDVTAAYRDRVQEYRRAILFVEPSMFVIYDHVIAKQPVSCQWVLHPPAATVVDPVWHDLRLESPQGGLRIGAPEKRRAPRSWERIETAVDALLPGTVTMQLAPTNKLTRLELLTVFGVQSGGTKTDYAFRLLEGDHSIGARIHRDGLPTIVAFRTDPAATNVSLTGFPFNGPVGVDVFKPKPKPGSRK